MKNIPEYTFVHIPTYTLIKTWKEYYCWCEAIIGKGNWNNSLANQYFAFANKEDAIAFKLKFGL